MNPVMEEKLTEALENPVTESKKSPVKIGQSIETLEASVMSNAFNIMAEVKNLKFVGVFRRVNDAAETGRRAALVLGAFVLAYDALDTDSQRQVLSDLATAYKAPVPEGVARAGLAAIMWHGQPDKLERPAKIEGKPQGDSKAGKLLAYYAAVARREASGLEALRAAGEEEKKEPAKPTEVTVGDTKFQIAPTPVKPPVEKPTLPRTLREGWQALFTLALPDLKTQTFLVNSLATIGFDSKTIDAWKQTAIEKASVKSVKAA